MPWTVADVDKHKKGLTDKQKRQWVAVANDALKRCEAKGGKDCDVHAIRQADAAVGKSDLAEFSMTIRKAYFDETSQEMRWKADASDIDDDSYMDNMSMELYADFMARIDANEPPPEPYKSDFWAGGLPYLSVSHYLDQNGNAVPGPTDAVYVDGKFLKAKGRFSDTPLGRACFKALCADLSEKSEASNKVRVSIAFLDYMHKHKSNGFLFERSEETPFCMECIKEFLSGEHAGKTYLKGHLIHLALTRVPVNQRTSMEVDKAMTTQKEDAASIVGEELAEELETKEKIVGKSETLVVRAEAEKCPKCGKEMVNGKCPECDKENAEKKPEKKSDVVEEIVVESKAKDDNAILAAIEDFKTEFKAFQSVLSNKSGTVETPHPLDAVFAQFKQDFDSILLSDVAAEEKLRQVQEPFNTLGGQIVDVIRAKTGEVTPEETKDDVSELTKAVIALSQKVDLLSAQVTSPKQVVAPVVPPRRSINPAQLSEALIAKKAKSVTPNLQALIERTVGL